MTDYIVTRAYLFDWIRTHGCEMLPLPENKARVVKFENPKTGGTAYLNMPIDDRPIKDSNVHGICSKPGIPVPRM
ncbi:MAG: hypothetical protein MI921_02820 [Cytophagales bacterium]|nr:hypothetical protein [Cytophagales bacterium]